MCADLIQIILDETLWGWSNAWLDRYCQKLNVVTEKQAEPVS